MQWRVRLTCLIFQSCEKMMCTQHDGMNLATKVKTCRCGFMQCAAVGLDTFYYFQSHNNAGNNEL